MPSYHHMPYPAPPPPSPHTHTPATTTPAPPPVVIMSDTVMSRALTKLNRLLNIDDDTLFPPTPSPPHTDLHTTLHTSIDIYATLLNPLHIAGRHTDDINVLNKQRHVLLNINNTMLSLCRLVVYSPAKFITAAQSMRTLSTFTFTPNTVQQQHVSMVLMYSNTVFESFDTIVIQQRVLTQSEYWRAYLVILGNMLHSPTHVELLVQQILWCAYEREESRTVCVTLRDLGEILCGVERTLGQITTPYIKPMTTTTAPPPTHRTVHTQTGVSRQQVVDNTNAELMRVGREVFDMYVVALDNVLTICGDVLRDAVDTLVEPSRPPHTRRYRRGVVHHRGVQVGSRSSADVATSTISGGSAIQQQRADELYPATDYYAKVATTIPRVPSTASVSSECVHVDDIKIEMSDDNDSDDDVSSDDSYELV